LAVAGWRTSASCRKGAEVSEPIVKEGEKAS